MIARLQGTVLESTPLLAVIDTGGVGYEVHIPLTTAEKLPQAGGTCTLFIHAVYREDTAALYGFINREDRDFFRLLVERVSGIGPKIGIGILSRMSSEVLQGAIRNGDVALLAKCPGLGKKTAERLVIELQDKVYGTSAEGGAAPGAADGGGGTPPGRGNFQDAVASLVTLGYKPAEADKLVRRSVEKSPAGADVETLVRNALS